MTLLAMQRDVQAWLRGEVDPGLGAGAEPGLSVYLNTYRSQLMACLESSFEVVRAWLGDSRFRSAAAVHIEQTPPRDWTLDAYSAGFPDTLAQRHPDDPEVADLARLEEALATAFVGPDSAAADLQRLGDLDWDHARLILAPTFSMHAVHTNAPAIWTAIRAGEPPPAARRLTHPGRIAVWRVGHEPGFRVLEAEEPDLLSEIVGGVPFGALCGGLVLRHGEADGVDLAGRFLATWLAEGLIVDVRPRD